jgi:hypothetical protein
MEYASKGVANAGLTTGIIGTALGALNNGMFGGILGNGNFNCCENTPVTRYELGQEQKISELQSQIALRDANTYNDQKTLELYRYIDAQLANISSQLSAQAVQNQSTKDSFQIMQERLDCAKHELHSAINAECKERKCADNTIVTYANATFYPKMVADVTVGTATTAQTLYNPLPVSSCGCGCGCN